jgi:hypothetical protein
MSAMSAVLEKYEQWKADGPKRHIARLPREMALGKRYFGSPTPISEQFRGRYFWLKAALGGLSTGGEGAKSRHIGYRALGQLTTPDKMKPVREALDRALTVPRQDDFYYKGEHLATRSILFAAEQVPELMDLITPQMLDAVRQYYGTNFRLLNVSAWRNWSIPSAPLAEEAYSNNWHTDGRRIDMLKVFVTGSDVTVDDGPTHVLSREWTHAVVRRGYNHRRDYQIPVEFIENPEHMVKLTGPAGTALLCNTNLCFHRASVPAEGRSRDLIEYRFIASPRFSLKMPANEEMAWRDRIQQ